MQQKFWEMDAFSFMQTYKSYSSRTVVGKVKKKSSWAHDLFNQDWQPKVHHAKALELSILIQEAEI